MIMTLMTVSNDALEIIKHFEGCSLVRYLCPSNLLSIGWGHVIEHGGNGNATIVTGTLEQNLQSITQDEADKILELDVGITAKQLNTLHFELKQNQFDALVSFIYNVGIGSFVHSTMIQLIKIGNFAGAADQFDRWVYNANGVALDGLVKRRRVEKGLFLGNEVTI